MRPRISICIPNYNRAENLIKLIHDIQNQTVKPYEVIVRDDCSSKKEISLIKKVLPKNYKLFINKKNLGLIKNINKSIEDATGNYLTIIHNDDRLSEFYIEEFSKAIKEYPDFHIYTSNGMGINEKGEIIGDYKFFNTDTVIKKISGAKRLWEGFFFTYISITGTTIYKTDFIQKKLFVEKYGNEADLEKALYFLSSENIMYIDKPLYFTLLHKNQESIKNKLTNKQLESYISNCLAIYSYYGPMFKDFVPNFLEKLKMIYFLQLFFKYHYPLKKVAALLKINSAFEFINIFLQVPLFILSTMRSRRNFKINLPYYNRYYSRNLNA